MKLRFEINTDLVVLRAIECVVANPRELQVGLLSNCGEMDRNVLIQGLRKFADLIEEKL